MLAHKHIQSHTHSRPGSHCNISHSASPLGFLGCIFSFFTSFTAYFSSKVHIPQSSVLSLRSHPGGDLKLPRPLFFLGYKDAPSASQTHHRLTAILVLPRMPRDGQNHYRQWLRLRISTSPYSLYPVNRPHLPILPLTVFPILSLFLPTSYCRSLGPLMGSQMTVLPLLSPFQLILRASAKMISPSHNSQAATPKLKTKTKFPVAPVVG